MKIVARLALGLAAVAAFAAPAAAKEWQIKMLNKGADGVMVFEPAFVKAAPGDTVKFLAVDKGHDAESIPGMLPDGVEGFKGKMNEEIVVPLAKPGLYGIKCTPHLGLGMVALVQVGKPVNMAAAGAGAAKLPGLAKMKMTKLMGQVK